MLDVIRWSSEYGKAIDYYFCYGDGTIDAAMKAYRHLTGDAPLMPKWMLGFWQCKERYASQEELLGVAKKYREMKVPVDGIIQDWQYWPPGNNTWGSHQFDPGATRIRRACSRNCTTMNYHTLISVWAKFDLGSDNSKELNDAGGMFPQVTRYVSPPGQGQWYDPFSRQGPGDLLEADARPALRQGRRRLVARCARAGNQRRMASAPTPPGWGRAMRCTTPIP